MHISLDHAKVNSMFTLRGWLEFDCPIKQELGGATSRTKDELQYKWSRGPDRRAKFEAVDISELALKRAMNRGRV